MFSTTNGFKRARDEDEPGFGEYETKVIPYTLMPLLLDLTNIITLW